MTLGTSERPGVRIGDAALSHVSLLLAALFVLTGFGYVMKGWELLFSSSGVVFGAGYADLHARLPAIRAMMVAAWVIAAFLVGNVRWHDRSCRCGPSAAGSLLLAVLLGVAPAALQSLVVNPNQGNKEAEYIALEHRGDPRGLRARRHREREPTR